MKRMLIFLGLIFWGTLFYLGANEKSRVAVLNFSARGVKEHLADAVVENLITSLIDSGVYEVIERNQLQLVMDELKLQNSDDFNDELRLELGNLYQVDLVILGSVTMIGDNITINVRGVEADTGVAKFAKNFITDSENDIPYLIPLLVEIISGKRENGLERRENEELLDSDKKKEAEEHLYHGERQELASYMARNDWETETIKLDSHERYRAILFEVSGNCVEISHIRVYTEDEKYKVSDNIMLDRDNDYRYLLKIESRGGEAVRVEKIRVGFKKRNCEGNKRAEITIWGER